VRLLLDTHFLLWAVIDADLIRPRERAAMAENELLVSPVSIWELRLKWQKRHSDGRRKGVLDPERALSYLAASSMELATLNGLDCAISLDPALDHGDPFDEQLMIHARQLNAKLLTRDRVLRDHPLAYRP